MTWDHTRESWNRLKTSLAEADQETQYDFFFWLVGLTMMGLAIIAQFGGLGFLFCFGLVVWNAANINFRKDK